jgi:putative selenate reductase
MQPQSFEFLLGWILKEFEARQSIFGIHKSLFYVPRAGAPYAVPSLFGHFLDNPIGPAAGPHTQLAQNIVCAWLSGARFLELKTVQVMDGLDIARPCIDMEDEGYNTEWSQELRLEESAREYIHAWALVHILHQMLGYGELPVGTICNASIGYDLAGIQSAPVTRFLDQLQNGSEQLTVVREVLRQKFPGFANVDFPDQVSNNITLSTMHGCPPDEIERIARYLLEERGLHTTVKLNPTLLGKDEILRLLHAHLGYHHIQIPEDLFEHDLQFEDAVRMIRNLRAVAGRRGLEFGVKLSNTLGACNGKGVLPGDRMYMSGRSLYPVTMHLFQKLAQAFDGDLNVSYSGGADAQNVSAILSCGAMPVTMATDLLKPGGYSRLLQYLENLESDMQAGGYRSLQCLAENRLDHLQKAVSESLSAARYRKMFLTGGPPKVSSALGLFDCIEAPCVEKCAVHQDVPGYAAWIARGQYDRALETILDRNPVPGATGYVCTRFCEACCTRSAGNYEQPVAIRALKKFAFEHGRVSFPLPETRGRRVAVLGSGPSGLSAAWYLARNGVQVAVFESRNEAGGMMRLAPAFRLPSAVIREDVERIVGLGVTIQYSSPVCRPPEDFLKQGFDAVYVAIGYQRNTPLYIEGIDGDGVIPALDLLESVRKGKPVSLGPGVAIIGGGDTAMDAARVSLRLTGRPPTILYRRTVKEMPARGDDRAGALEEGIIIEELTSPTRVLRSNGRIIGLECLRNTLGEPEQDGRRRPIPLPGSTFRLKVDTIVVAVGQSPDFSLLSGSTIACDRSGITVEPATGLAAKRVYAGGDAVGGPASIVEACADGRRAAESICADLGIAFKIAAPAAPLGREEYLRVKRNRARRDARRDPETIPPGRRSGFELIESTLTEEAARAEAARCLQCSSICDKCVEVCPNRANQGYEVPPFKVFVPVLARENGLLVQKGTKEFSIHQSRQIVHFHELCNDCGNCATFCVHQGKPYVDKPRLFFAESKYLQQNDNAFLLTSGNGQRTLRRREKGRESRLTEDSGKLTYENDFATVQLDGADFRVIAMRARSPFTGKLDLTDAAEMKIVLSLRLCAPVV